MHVKTKIEHSPVQLIVLAMCPLLLALDSVKNTIFFFSGTIICLIISQLFIVLFNKYLNNDTKSLLTAVVSTMVVTVSSILVKHFTDKTLPDNAYLMIFSTLILNAEFVYFSSKAMTKYYFFNILRIVGIFSLEMLFYSVIKEFFAHGSILDVRIFESFEGFHFCRNLIYDFILLATLCAVLDFFVRKVEKKIENKNMLYQKYVRIIRSEKAFQYDKLRREKLLANEIEVNRINKTDSEKIKQKQAENEAISSVKDVILEEEEVLEEKGTDEGEVAQEEKSQEDSKSAGKSKKKGKKGGKK